MHTVHYWQGQGYNLEFFFYLHHQKHFVVKVQAIKPTIVNFHVSKILILVVVPP